MVVLRLSIGSVLLMGSFQSFFEVLEIRDFLVRILTSD